MLEEWHSNETEVALGIEHMCKEIAKKRPDKGVGDPMAVHINAAKSYQWDANVHREGELEDQKIKTTEVGTSCSVSTGHRLALLKVSHITVAVDLRDPRRSFALKQELQRQYHKDHERQYSKNHIDGHESAQIVNKDGRFNVVKFWIEVVLVEEFQLVQDPFGAEICDRDQERNLK